MDEGKRTVEMALIKPGTANAKGEYTFELEPRFNAGRTVTFSLTPTDALELKKALEEYFKVQR